MDWIEIVAAVFGFAAVVLTALRKPLCWPIGLVQVLLYLHVFYARQLYSQVLLYVLFAVLQIQGWWHWRQTSAKAGDSTSDEVEVRALPKNQFAIAVAIAIGISCVLAWFMKQFTSAVMTETDALITGFSLVAQWLMIQRMVENWLLWIIVDLLTIYMCIVLGMHVTLTLYILFLIIAISGAISWYQRLKSQQFISA